MVKWLQYGHCQLVKVGHPQWGLTLNLALIMWLWQRESRKKLTGNMAILNTAFISAASDNIHAIDDHYDDCVTHRYRIQQKK